MTITETDDSEFPFLVIDDDGNERAKFSIESDAEDFIEMLESDADDYDDAFGDDDENDE